MSAESRFFAVPELESILLNLPLVDILFAQRVGRTFRDGIKQSPSLRALFLKPNDDFSLHVRQGSVPETACLATIARQNIMGKQSQARPHGAPSGCAVPLKHNAQLC